MDTLTTSKLFGGIVLVTIVVTIITKSWIPIVAIIWFMLMVVLISFFAFKNKGEVIDKSELSEEYKKFIDEDDDEVLH